MVMEASRQERGDSYQRGGTCKASSQLERFPVEEKDDSPEGRDTEKAALSQALLKMHGMAAGPRGPLGCLTPLERLPPSAT